VLETLVKLHLRLNGHFCIRGNRGVNVDRGMVTLHWSMPYRERDDARWGYNLALYAYLRARSPEILYIGKADGRTIWQRLNDPDKDKLWRDLGRELHVKATRVIVAEFETRLRVTRQLVYDVESLLIYTIKPVGNIQATRSRSISRPSLVVHCEGEAWPYPRRTFRDE
jgi:hypothetical protein